jgi:two-component system sensor histidine kinase UhpB
MQRWIRRTRERLHGLSILNRLLLGNSAVIVVGAVGGTLLTQRITLQTQASDLWLIGLFAGAGILLSLLVNYWIVKITLRPLRELRQAVDGIQTGRAGASLALTAGADPDLSRLAAAVDSLLERMEGRAVELRALSERAINAQEEERKRIARGLHDDIGQTLSRLIIDLEHMEGGLPPEADLRRSLAAARERACRTLDELRQVIYGLRPGMLDDLGLAPAIRWYARSNLEPAGARLRFDGFDESLRLEPRLEITLFRIAQETINNILRHSQASTVVIGLRQDGGGVCLSVADDGCGFDLERTTRQALPLHHFGLLGIQERAELVGGTAEVASQPGQGTRVCVRVPLSQEPAYG